MLMKRLLLLLPLVALAACSGKPETTGIGRPETTTTAPKNDFQNNISERFKQQEADKEARKNYCLDEYDKASYEGDNYEASNRRFSIKKIKGVEYVIKWKPEYASNGSCSFQIYAHFEKSYRWDNSRCALDWPGSPGSYECWATKEPGKLVMYVQHKNEIKKKVFAREIVLYPY